ncbi:MAG: APC family permease [Nocardioides sp.]|nr:APC family permease [Nocardioides sp.]
MSDASTRSTGHPGTDVDGAPKLKRVLGPKLLLLFIVGDVLGAGIYAITGQVAGEVGGAAWLPFLVAFAVATLTAFAYLELVTKYPHAAGAALYTHKAFRLHFVTFMVAFAVICSGITSASTSANVLAANLLAGLEGAGWGVGTGSTAVLAVALGFMLLLAVVNLRGVGESVKFNVVLTVVEMVALLIVIGVGFFAMSQGNADLGRVMVFESAEGKSLFIAVTAATSLAFFAMVGFEDSVNMVEETREPERIFPRIMLTGLGIAVSFYVLVSITAVALVPVGELAESDTALLDVVAIGAPDFPIDKVFPFLTVFAVANTALINMLMASRLLYGMGKQDVLPRVLSRVLPGRRTPWVAIVFSTALALGLIVVVAVLLAESSVEALSGTTALLLLGVFAVVNVACLVLRRDPVDGVHFTAPTVIPALGAVACLFFVGPWTGRDTVQYTIAAGLLVVGVGLWVLTWLENRAFRAQRTGFHDPTDLSG